MTKMKNVEVKTGGEIFVPLNLLKKSPRNVRKVSHGEADVAALAASIAANGLLQNLVIEQETKGGKLTGCYLVTVGEGRRLALLLRAKRKEIDKAAPVRCVLGESAAAHEASLAENAFGRRCIPPTNTRRSRRCIRATAWPPKTLPRASASRSRWCGSGCGWERSARR